MYKQFKELLAEIQPMPMQKQKEILEQTINEWMSDTRQIDDIMMIGFRISS